MKPYSKPNIIVLGREINENILSACKAMHEHSVWHYSYCQCQYVTPTGFKDCDTPCKVYSWS